MTAADALRVLHFLPAQARDASAHAVSTALGRGGWISEVTSDPEVVASRVPPTEDVQASPEVPGGDIIHVHEIGTLLEDEDARHARSALRGLLVGLGTARLRGAAVVVGMPDVPLPPRPGLAALLSGLGKLATLIIVPGERARRLGERFGEGCPVRVVPHAVYLPDDRAPVDAASARSRLALPAEEHVLLLRVDGSESSDALTVVEAFASAGPAHGRLVVAGVLPPDDPLGSAVRALGHRRARLVDTGVPEELEAQWFAAADLAVALPGGIAGTSLLPLLHGVPVLAPDKGSMREYVVHGRNGLLYTPGDPRSLAAVMHRAAANPLSRSTSIRRSVDHCAPAAVAACLDIAYRFALEARWAVPDAGGRVSPIPR